jgi:pimeloyl-ACP methyl ester carboxylesterase
VRKTLLIAVGSGVLAWCVLCGVALPVLAKGPAVVASGGEQTVVPADGGQTSVPAGEKQTAVSPDGVEIAFSVEGKGEPALVFVHGWCFDRSYWKNQVPDFAKSHTVVTVDLGGHGESGLGRKDWTIQAFGQDVAAVIEKLKLERVILIGHSMGGAVIIEAAKLIPDKVIALIGIDTYQNLEQDMPEEAVTQFLAAFKTDFAGTTRTFIKRLFPANADSALVESVAADAAAAPQDVATSALANVFRYKPRAALEGLKIPVYAVNGDLYPTNVEAGKRVAYSFDVQVIPGSGHFPMLEKPAVFNERLGETIDGIVKR